MKLAVHELESACEAIAGDQLAHAFKMLARVSRILEQLNNAWDVLRTLTPSEYTEFREDLGQSSGFQSHQYRAIEFLCGNRNAAMLKPHAHQPAIVGELRAILARPSLYDEAIGLLGRSGFDVGDERADLAGQRAESPKVQAAWRAIYQAPDQHWALYELAEKLVDLEYHLQLWRFSHLKTVERVIGFKRGTGGTAGVSYLAKVVEQRVFPELLDVRTSL